MGMSNMQVQQPMQQGGGKGSGMPQNGQMPSQSQFRDTSFTPPMESIAEETQPNPSMNYGQQPRFGQPNRYSNTVSPWDNASIQPQQRPVSGGKGKG